MTFTESGETASASFELWRGDALKAGPFTAAAPTEHPTEYLRES